MYCCQHMRKNIPSLGFKTVLRHSPFFFDHFGCYFASIRHTVAKIQRKILLCWLWNWFYGIHFFFCNLMVILLLSDLLFPKYRKKRCFFRLWNWFYSIRHSFLSTLVIILLQSDLPLQGYERKRCFADFETGFKVLAVHFWAFWWLFCISIWCTVAKIRVKRYFVGFETGFTTFAVLSRALWCLFCLKRTYRCQDTGKNVASLALKLVLWYFVLIF